ncbi:MAG: 5-amino-6-(5-phosphoribosylamino)uracil reductase, partial [Alistipes sp.]|nr:5-amino-6-(5-phosphoribosylamino)uracil reductase [Alistipes sp.]
MRPYIICHMIASVDGRIDCDMTEQIEGGNEYYEALESLACPSMLMGRVTM